MNNRNLKAYKDSGVAAELAVADPHRVIQLMMQGLLERLAQAKGAIERHDMEAKSVAISKAQGLLHGLQDALDMSQGNISENLHALYSYIDERIWDASLALDIKPIEEAIYLVITIKSGWDQLPEIEKRKGFDMRSKLGEL